MRVLLLLFGGLTVSWAFYLPGLSPVVYCPEDEAKSDKSTCKVRVTAAVTVYTVSLVSCDGVPKRSSSSSFVDLHQWRNYSCIVNYIDTCLKMHKYCTKLSSFLQKIFVHKQFCLLFP
jgi:hypothetical protein